MTKTLIPSCMAILLTSAAWAQSPAGTPASGAKATPPAASEATGVRARVADVLAPDYVSDTNLAPDGNQTLRIVGVRNAAHSAKVVLSSGAPIRGLDVQVSEFKPVKVGASPSEPAGGPSIPAAAAQVRFTLPWGSCLWPRDAKEGITYGARPGYLGLLAEAPPKEFGMGKVAVRRSGRDGFDTYGPVVPVWLTVKLPATAAPGEYAAQVTLRAEGEKPITLPFQLKVLPWVAPDPANWQTWIEVIESPDTLAIEYGVQPWSKEHWDLIARSFRYLRDLGDRIVYVPLIGHTNMGHEQSMVRWVKKADGTYAHDFTILDQYLDTAEKNLGKPQIVAFYVWENYMIRKGELATGAAAAHEQQRIVEQMEKEGGLMGKGPAVTVVDEGGKDPRLEYLPHYTEAASKALWKPLFDGLQQRLTKRGLSKAAMLGMLNDCWPTKAEVAFFKELAPDMPWVLHAHFGKGDAYGLAKVGNRAQVWSLEAPKDKGLLGWKRPDLLARFDREAEFGAAPLHAWRFWAEYCLCGGQRGVARLGAEYWPVFKDKQGSRRGNVWERFPESSWRNLGIYTSLLGAGEKGPLATPRLEMMREGMQECEARIAIEKALTDEAAKSKLGADLAKRCQDELNERIARMMERMERRPGNRSGWNWPLKDGWQVRGEKLFALAGEVQKKLEGK